MARKLSFVLLVLSLLLAVNPLGLSHGLGGSTLTAPTRSNVTIDGTLGPAEWSDGTHLSFNWASNNGSLTGGGDVWVKTNGTDLLVAVGANGRTTLSSGTDAYPYSLSLLFDNDNNGVVNNMEDAKRDTVIFGSSGPVQAYEDLHYNSSIGGGVYIPDTYVNGTAAGSHSNPGGSGGWVWEFATPMISSRAEDFNLVENASIGFEIVYTESHYSFGGLVSTGWAYWEVSYPNGFPSGPSPSANGWAVIVRTNLPAPISDNTPPTIATPTIQPNSPGPGDLVTVSVDVTDSGSGVKNVSIVYTTDNWKNANKTIAASYNITSHIATAQIPAQQYGGHVAYYVVAFDNAGNKAINNNLGSYFNYDVQAPWYLNTFVYGLLAAAITIFVIGVMLATRRKKTPGQSSAKASE